MVIRKFLASVLTVTMLVTSLNVSALGLDLTDKTASSSGTEVKITSETNSVSYNDSEMVILNSANEAEAQIFETISENQTVSDNEVSENSVSQNSPHTANISGVEPKIQRLNDGTYVAVKGQKIICGKGTLTSNKKIIAINKKGVGTAKKPGTATITYPDGQTFDVKVINGKTNVKKLNMKVGESIDLSFIADGAENNGLKTAWQVQNPSIIQNYENKFVAVAKGKTTIFATVGGKQYKIKVKVADPGNNSVYVLNSYIGKKPIKIPFKAKGISKTNQGASVWSISSVDSEKTLETFSSDTKISSSSKSSRNNVFSNC